MRPAHTLPTDAAAAASPSPSPPQQHQELLLDDKQLWTRLVTKELANAMMEEIGCVVVN